MIISYPILSQHINSTDDEDERMRLMLTHELLSEGTYPVSHDQRWHGGIHLDTHGEPLRAIADGIVACFRVPGQTETYPGQGAYDTGFVLLKHETETGEASPVVFYSLYMHLRPLAQLTKEQRDALPAFLREAATDTVIRGDTLPAAQQKVWRKDILGHGGQLRGRRNRCHFEVFTTDEALNRFWRDSNAVPAGGKGHADWYGDTYYKVPAGCTFHAQPPAASREDRRWFEPALQAGRNAYPLLVRVRLHRGDERVTVWEQRERTHDEDGQRLSPARKCWQEITPAGGQRNAEFEYTLYQRATDLYPSCPSAGFELLRGGRLDGPDAATLDPGEKHNIHAVHFAEGQRGYIDLNLPEHCITVLSDADFPAELGWRKVEEGRLVNATDGIADVDRIKGVLALADVNHDGSTTADEVHAYLTSKAGEQMRTTMRHWVCKHPSEWDARTLEQRYGNEREPGRQLHDEAAWQRFHVSTPVARRPGRV